MTDYIKFSSFSEDSFDIKPDRYHGYHRNNLDYSVYLLIYLDITHSCVLYYGLQKEVFYAH